MSLLRGIARSAVGSAARRGARRSTQSRSAGSDILGIVVGAVAARVATRSVPGAILVGGGLLAKYLWDKRQQYEAEDASLDPIADGAETATEDAPADA